MSWAEDNGIDIGDSSYFFKKNKQKINNMSERQFCGSGKVIPTQYGDLTKISFSEKDLEVLKSNLSNGWVNCVLKEKKEKQENKPTHYLEIDNWKPEQSKKPEPKEYNPDSPDEDLPF